MKKNKKTRHRKRWLYWLLFDLAVVSGIFILLLHKPSDYDPPEILYSNQVSPYLTHQLSPQLYDGIQLDEPFNVVITQNGINDIIARRFLSYDQGQKEASPSKWSNLSEGAELSKPLVSFVPQAVVLMATAKIKGSEFIVTIVVKPAIDEQGLLNLQVAKVKLGAVNITLVARMIAKRIYTQRFASADIDPEELESQVIASLLEGVPFAPILKIYGEKLQVSKIDCADEKLMLRLVPVPD